MGKSSGTVCEQWNINKDFCTHGNVLDTGKQNVETLNLFILQKCLFCNLISHNLLPTTQLWECEKDARTELTRSFLRPQLQRGGCLSWFPGQVTRLLSFGKALPLWSRSLGARIQWSFSTWGPFYVLEGFCHSPIISTEAQVVNHRFLLFRRPCSHMSNLLEHFNSR